MHPHYCNATVALATLLTSRVYEMEKQFQNSLIQLSYLQGQLTASITDILMSVLKCHYTEFT